MCKYTKIIQATCKNIQKIYFIDLKRFFLAIALYMHTNTYDKHANHTEANPLLTATYLKEIVRGVQPVA